MTQIAATLARQRWAWTIDSAKRGPVTITEHGRETVMLLDFDTAQRALQALEDAEDAAAAAAAEHKIKDGGATVSLEDVARELGVSID